MSATDGVGVTAAAPLPSAATDLSIVNISPDALLAFCRMQLGDLDSQVNDAMNEQQIMVREHQAVSDAQQVLSSFGNDGPQDGTNMEKCVQALNDAIQKLPQGDPVAGQLATFRDNMISQYKYHGPGAPADAPSPSTIDVTPLDGLLVSKPASLAQRTDLDPIAGTLQTTTATPTIDNPPNKDIDEWQTTTAALGQIANDSSSTGEIQMLELQDLVSKRQQVVQLCSGIMGKEDQSLEDLAKAIGQ